MSDYDRRPAPRTVRDTFVPPAPAPIVRRVEVLPPEPHEVSPALPVQTVQKVTTSAVDRAKGFSIVSIPLAAMAGFVAFLVAVGLFSVPIVSGAALVVLFGTFAGVWLVAWIWHQSASPDGITLWTVILHYKLLRHEQKARLERMRKELDR
jgi:hypothetical protein